MWHKPKDVTEQCYLRGERLIYFRNGRELELFRPRRMELGIMVCLETNLSGCLRVVEYEEWMTPQEQPSEVLRGYETPDD